MKDVRDSSFNLRVMDGASEEEEMAEEKDIINFMTEPGSR